MRIWDTRKGSTGTHICLLACVMWPLTTRASLSIMNGASSLLLNSGSSMTDETFTTPRLFRHAWRLSSCCRGGKHRALVVAPPPGVWVRCAMCVCMYVCTSYVFMYAHGSCTCRTAVVPIQCRCAPAKTAGIKAATGVDADWK